MPDKLESHITFNTLIHNIVGPGRIDGMRITPGIIIEEVVDADTDLSQTITENPFTQIKVTQQRPIIKWSGDTLVLSVWKWACKSNPFPESPFKLAGNRMWKIVIIVFPSLRCKL